MKPYKVWPWWVKIVTAPISKKNIRTSRFYFLSAATVFVIMLFLEFIQGEVVMRFFLIGLVVLSVLQGMSIQWIKANSNYELKETNYVSAVLLFLVLGAMLLIGIVPYIWQGWSTS